MQSFPGSVTPDNYKSLKIWQVEALAAYSKRAARKRKRR